MPHLKVDPRCLLFGDWCTKVRFLLELFRLETAVVASDALATVRVDPLLVIAEVVHQFFLEYSPGTHVRNIRARAEIFIHFPSHLQRYAIFLLEDIVAVFHKVVHVIRSAQHANGNIIVIGMFVILVDITTVPCNSTKLKVDLRDQLLVLLSWHLIASGFHIDQTPNNTRLRIGDAHRVVCAKDEKALEAVLVGRLKLFVDRHGLVRDQ